MFSFGSIELRALERTDLPKLQQWRNIQTFRDQFREFRELGMVQQERWFEMVQSANSNFHMFGIVDKAHGELIGAAGLNYIHWAYRNADFSFYIGRDNLYADDKFGADAARALLFYGFKTLNLKRLYCELYETDKQKIELLGQLGFKKEGTLRCNAFKNGRYVDGFMFSILDTEAAAIIG